MSLLLTNIIFHGLIFAFILTVYLLIVMVAVSPRVWAFSDYPKTITNHVPPQTKSERRKGAVVAVPFFVLGIAFPYLSTLLLEGLYGGALPILDAFLNVFGIWMFGFMADLLILDLLIVGTITPNFVIIPGTEHMKNKEYKDFRLYHTKGHLKGLLLLGILSLILAALVVFL
ncbi:MAG: hypothetical protein ACFFCO_05755 [Promethearchaeota archaeon]